MQAIRRDARVRGEAVAWNGSTIASVRRRPEDLKRRKWSAASRGDHDRHGTEVDGPVPHGLGGMDPGFLVGVTGSGPKYARTRSCSGFLSVQQATAPPKTRTTVTAMPENAAFPPAWPHASTLPWAYHPAFSAM